jgi:hypothetical protein
MAAGLQFKNCTRQQHVLHERRNLEGQRRE